MKIAITQVTAKTRQLSATYTIEQQQDAEHHISDDLTKILQEEINREIIEEITGPILVEQGWTKIPITVWRKVDIQSWMKENMQDEYRFFATAVYFKSCDDAILYTLKWSE